MLPIWLSARDVIRSVPVNRGEVRPYNHSFWIRPGVTGHSIHLPSVVE
jgi:hypothetical protein